MKTEISIMEKIYEDFEANVPEWFRKILKRNPRWRLKIKVLILEQFREGNLR